MFYHLKYFILFYIVVVAVCGYFYGNQTKTTTIDPFTRIKKKVQIENFGSGGGFTATAPALTKVTLTKYDSTGKLIYLSHKDISRNGCFYSTSRWEVLSFNASGIINSFVLSDTFYIIKNFNKNEHLISETKIKFRDFIGPDWFDKEEMKQY